MSRRTLILASWVLGFGCQTKIDLVSDAADTDTGGTGVCEQQHPGFAPADRSQCSVAATDYLPQQESDSWPACATDDGSYHLVENSPSSIARVDAYEDILALLVDPTPDKFTQARITYALDEGLESRVVRREDLHYPPIPESDWEPGVDADKQCSVIENAQKYPERCAGPARIAPILNEAFAAGQSGEEELAVHAARIDAALLWFFYISVFKEANTCALLAPKDCDSSWAYYSGGTQRSDGHGFAAQLLNIDHQAHHAIFDGILAFRCWRELHAFVEGEEPTPEAQQLLDDATAQLDDALVHGYAIIVRAHLERQARVCELSARANWAYLQIAGPALEFHGRARDPALYGELAAIWQLDEPMAVDIERAVEIIDTLFTCPRHAS